MCSAKKPSVSSTAEPLVVQSPEMEAEVNLAGTSEEKKNRRKKASAGTSQLMIPTNSGVGTSGGSGVGGV